MSKRREKMEPSMVDAIKKDLVSGVKQIDIAAKHLVSQPTISMIRSGVKYKDVPWPNGECGSFRDAYPKGLPGAENTAPGWTVGAAEEFSKHSETMQRAMLGWVNRTRRERGIVEIPPVTVEFESWVNSDSTEYSPQENARRETMARDSESKRRALIYDEFHKLQLALESDKRNESVQTVVNIGREIFSNPKTDLPEPVPLDPEKYTTLTVEKMRDEDPQHPTFRRAITAKNAELLEATLIVLHDIPRGQWRADGVLESIRGVSNMVRRSKAALRSGKEHLLQCRVHAADET